MDHLIQDKIQQNYSNLTRNQRALSHFILEHTEEVPFLSSALLARRVRVSDATVTRFCTALGYSGYADFQKDMQRWLQMRLAPSERIKKKPHQQKGNIYRQVYEADIQNLKETMDGNPAPKLEEGMRILSHSKRIFIVGLRRAFALALLTHDLLRQVCPRTVLLDASQGRLFDPMIDIGPQDTLLVMSFPRYSEWTHQVARYAKNQGCLLIAITDSLLSPLGQIADLTLPVKISGKSFFSSYTAVVYIINCLITRLSLVHHKKTVKALKKVESKLRVSDTWVMEPP